MQPNITSQQCAGPDLGKNIELEALNTKFSLGVFSFLHKVL